MSDGNNSSYWFLSSNIIRFHDSNVFHVDLICSEVLFDQRKMPTIYSSENHFVLLLEHNLFHVHIHYTDDSSSVVCVFFSYRWGKKSYVPFTLITPTWQKNKHTNTYILTSQQKGILMIHISRTVTKQLMTHTQIQQLNTTWNQTYRTKHRTKLTHITHKIVFARISASSTPAFTCTI